MADEHVQSPRSDRVPFEKPVRVVPLTDGPPKAFRVLSSNLSRRGMCVSLPEPLAEGTPLALSLEADGQAWSFAQAEVIWTKPPDDVLDPVDGVVLGNHGVGLRFTHFLNPGAEALVDHYCRPKTPKPTDDAPGLDFDIHDEPQLAAGFQLPPLRAESVGAPMVMVNRTSWLRWVVMAVASLAIAFLGALLARQFDVQPPKGFAELEQPNAQKAEVQAPQPAKTEVAPARAEAAAASDFVGPPAVKPAVIKANPSEVPPASAKAPAPAAAPSKQTAPAKTAPAQPATVASAKEAVKPAQQAPTKPAAVGGTVQFPHDSGALRWEARGDRLSLELSHQKSAHIIKVFQLKGPERLVIDLDGPAPLQNHNFTGAKIPDVDSVRMGKRDGGGTRFVLELSRPMKMTRRGDKIELSR